MGDSAVGILCIVAFVVYPFAMAGVAHALSRGVRDCQSRNLLMKIFAGVGLIPALLISVLADAKYRSVNVLAAFVLVMCFIATGAAIGAARDRRRERDSGIS